MILCRKCGFENYSGTRYCQKCGFEVLPTHKNDFFHSLLGTIAKICNPGYTLAPLIGIQVDNQEHVNQSHSYIKVPVIPLDDGSWYCPDCGEHNNQNHYICYGCGRDFTTRKENTI